MRIHSGALLGGIVVLASCSGGDGRIEESSGVHTHVHVAPHGGTLVVLGEEFAHLELVFDPATGTVEAYILDGEAESGVAIADRELRFAIGGLESPLVLEARSSALTGEEVGNSSTFAGRWTELIDRVRFRATLEEITVRGIPFRGVEFWFPEGNEEPGERGEHEHDGREPEHHEDEHEDH